MCSMTQTYTAPAETSVHTREPIHARAFDGDAETARFVPFPVELLLNAQPGWAGGVVNGEGAGEHGFYVLSADEARELHAELGSVLELVG